MLVATAPGAVVVGLSNARYVMAVLPKLQVLKSIVRAIAILVMDLFVRLKKSAKAQFHSYAMLDNGFMRVAVRVVRCPLHAIAVVSRPAVPKLHLIRMRCIRQLVIAVPSNPTDRVALVDPDLGVAPRGERSIASASALADARRRRPSLRRPGRMTVAKFVLAGHVSPELVVVALPTRSTATTKTPGFQRGVVTALVEMVQRPLSPTVRTNPRSFHRMHFSRKR